MRTSNAYEFNALPCESEKPRGTMNPEINPSLETAAAPKNELSGGLAEGVAKIWDGIRRKAEAKLT
jgi:hypothetical protein